jgi:hypothetical protein
MRMGVVVGSQQLLRNLDIVAKQFRHRGISMKRLAIAVSVLGISAASAFAADLPARWSLALEYDHLFMFESDNAFTAVPGSALTRIDSIHQDVDLVTARLNYRFGGPGVARY